MNKKFTKLVTALILISCIEISAQAPTIDVQPVSQGVIEGQAVTFSVGATGSGLSYQWYKDADSINGATSSSYDIASAALGDNGAVFSVAVSNTEGTDSSAGAVLYVTAAGNRVTEGQVVLYNFDEGSGSVINDAGPGSPLNMTINRPQNVSWSDVSLLTKADSALINSATATKIINAAQSTNELTVELWIKPLKINTATERIFVLAQTSTQFNFVVEAYYQYDGFNFSIRNADSSVGLLETGGITTDLVHLTFTSKNGITKIYRDGTEAASRNIGGDFSQWFSSARLSLASYLSGLRPWNGIFYLASVYNRALDSAEVVQNYSMGIDVEEAPFIIEEPQNAAVLAGYSATFAVKAIGNRPFTYEWRKDGVIAGNDSVLVTGPLTLDDDGAVFTVTVSNADGSDVSQNAVLNVLEGAADCPAGIVHYYRFEESTPPYEDSYAFTDAVSADPPASVAGKAGNAVDFAGNTVTIPDDNLSEWANDESFSIELWVKTTAAGTGNKVFIGRYQGGTLMSWWLGYGDANTPVFSVRDSDNIIAVATGTELINDGEWNHIVAVRDAVNDSLKLYINGSFNTGAAAVYTGDFSSTADITVGSYNSGFEYTGSIDELAIFHTALTPQEILDHYNAGSSGYGLCESMEAPYNLTAQPEFMRIELAWEDSSGKADGFIIERGLSAGSFSVIDSTDASTLTYSDFSISDTTSYKYRVKGYNEILHIESGYSNEATVTSLLSSISAPENLTAISSLVDSTLVDLEWDDNSSNELGFVIERAAGGILEATDFSVVDTVDADETVYTDTTVSDTTTYTYRVFAFNADTVSDYSNLAEITTKVPVELTSFTARASKGRMLISWQTATEINNKGFSVERSIDNIKFSEVAFIEGKGTTTEKSDYSYLDKSVLSGKYFYRLKQVDFDGTFYYSNSVSGEIEMPKEFSLEQNYPNPFNPVTTIRFALPLSSKVNLKVFNTLGQEVASILNGDLEAGIQEIVFNASNLSSGVYFYRLEARSIEGDVYSETKRFILMK